METIGPDRIVAMISKIVSGGQAGVDRAALDVAIHLGITHGGWCPKGRRAEDGKIAAIYQLQETKTSNYAERTEKNIIDSDGTLILHLGPITGGTLLTLQLAKRWNKPCLTVDLAKPEDCRDGNSQNNPNLMAGLTGMTASIPVNLWVREHRIETLNIAGPRESGFPGVGQMAREFLFSLLDGLNAPNSEVELEDA